MSKKGFTLVELLAVIAILAILVIIAMPNVTNMLNKARINSFITEVQEITRQASTQAVADSITSGSTDTTYDSDETTSAVKALDLDGAAKNYKVTVKDSKVTEIMVFDDRFCFYLKDETKGITPAEIQNNEDHLHKHLKDDIPAVPATADSPAIPQKDKDLISGTACNGDPVEFK